MARVMGQVGAMTWHDDVTEARPADRPVVSADELVLAPETRNVRTARAWVAAHLPAWATEDVREAVVLLTSELVTNAVVHARTEVAVGVAITSKDVLVGVRDLDLGRSELPGAERDGGRGLGLVEELATAWGLRQHPGGGKTYWFRVTA